MKKRRNKRRSGTNQGCWRRLRRDERKGKREIEEKKKKKCDVV